MCVPEKYFFAAKTCHLKSVMSASFGFPPYNPGIFIPKFLCITSLPG